MDIYAKYGLIIKQWKSLYVNYITYFNYNEVMK